MASISIGRGGSLYSVRRWLGLNENPGGDTELGWGEAAVMRNFRVTKEGSLQIRPGYAEKLTLVQDAPVRGMWTGYVAGRFVWLAACGGQVWRIDKTAWTAEAIGAVADEQVTFFPFSGKVYLLDGSEYYVWDGETFQTVAGYIPIVATATPPAGGGTLLEPVNKLTGKKRQHFSPNGSATVFQLAEKAVDSIDSVKLGGAEVTTGITRNTAAGTVTWTAAPAAGTNTLEITWTKGTGDRARMTGQRFAEAYNGYTDSRIFLYGDGTNKAYYSGLDEHGSPTAEYFPDLNVLSVGEENTPITAMVRQFSKLMVFKPDSTYLTDYSSLTLEDGSVTAGFYTRGVERNVGHASPGQVRLVNNFPISLAGNSAYRWGLLYSGGVQDERNARRISDRIRDTLGGLKLDEAVTFDDEWNRELWIVQGETACIYQYANEAQGDFSYKNNLWYVYTGIPAASFISVEGALYFGTRSGALMHMSRNYHSDGGRPIDAYWESGSIYFKSDTQRKWSSEVWVAMKPEGQARVRIASLNETGGEPVGGVLSSGLSSFSHLSFSHLSFGTSRRPRVRRLRIKIRKFIYYKLTISSLSASATATVLSVDIRVRDAGTVT
ncbi:hypothetical protein SDC9_72466 [bioreactor metagenome]|uniref:Uncharacterized protein n=1 Tax=bioreactor metagenome TaxID=1076179 RepID=A0A644YBP9_9ZZZZ